MLVTAAPLALLMRLCRGQSRYLEDGASFEVVDDFGVANGLCGLGADGGVFGEEGTDLVEQTCVDHAFDAEVDAVVVVFAGAS